MAIGAKARRAGGESEIRALIDLIYAAATDPAGWPAFLEQLARTSESAMAGLALHDLQTHRREWVWQFGVDPAALDEDARWAPRNPFMLKGGHLVSTGSAINVEAVVPDREVVGTEYFNEYLRRQGVLHHIAACIFREQSMTAMLFLPRWIGKPSHAERHVLLVKLLMPHLQRAITIQRRLHSTALERAAVAEALDRLPMGVFLLRDDGAVIFYNRTGRGIIDRNDGLRLVRDGLTADRAQEATGLRDVIGSACRTGTNGLQRGGSLQVSRSSGGRPYEMLVAPLRLQAFALSASVPTAIAFCSDPDRNPEGLEDVLRQLYGLTPAESRVVSLLLSGFSIQEASERLAISASTGRTHLKRILSKAAVRSQAQLIRVLLAGPASLWSAQE